MKRVLSIAGVLTILVVGASMIYFAYSARHGERANAPKIMAAAMAYADTLKAAGMPVPASVSLQELLSRNLLRESDVSAFKGMEVTINLAADETHPQTVLVRARLPDGSEFVTLADGSAQQVSSARNGGSK